MKAIIYILVLIFGTSALAQNVVVTTAGNVTVDGVDIGSVVENANGKQVNPSLLQAAIVTAFAQAQPLRDLLTKAQDALNVPDDADPAKTLANLKTILQPAVDDAKLTEIQREIKKLQQVIADAQKRIDELSGQLTKASAALKAAKPAPAPVKKK